MTHDRLIEVDESFDDSIGVIAAVLARCSGTVHEGIVRADVIGADFPFIRVIGNSSKEDSDGKAGRELELVEFDPRGPIVGSMVGGSSVRFDSDRSLRGPAQARTVANGILRGQLRARAGIGRFFPGDVISIQFIDCFSNGNLDGVCISCVQAVEFGIGVAESCGTGGAGRGPERGLLVGERSQSWNERYSQTPPPAIQSTYPCSHRRACLRK